MKQSALVILGAIVGGLIGHFAFLSILRYGFYAMVLPGGLVGLGAGWTRNPSRGLAVICGVMALAIGFVSEWRGRPFIADSSFIYFITHLVDLGLITWVMIGLGGVIGFWIPFRQIAASPNNPR